MPKPKQILVEGLVTSDTVYRDSRKWFVLGAAILLAIISVGGWYAWNHLLAPPKPAPTKQAVDYSQLSPEEAVKAAQDAVKNASTPSEKKAAYTALGDAYVTAGQTSKGTAAYKQAITYTTSDDIPLLERLSHSYEVAGDRTNAIETLEKLIAALKASNLSEKDFLLSRYEAELRYEQGRG